MKRLLKNLAEYLIIIISIVTINFLLIRFMPGDPVIHIIGEDEYLRLSMQSPEVIQAVRAEYGLDKSVAEQYITYLKKMSQLDFGNSFRTKTPVLETVMFRLRWTLLLAVPSTIIAALLGGWMGLKAGWKRGGFFDTIFSPIMLIISTIPINCLAILFLIVFAFRMGAFPISGITSGGLSGMEKVLDIMWHMVLPVSILTLVKTSSNFMLMRSTVSSVRDEEYVTVAFGKGLSENRVRRSHLLKNALCPYITSICMQFGYILSGSMMVEVVFSWKGMGTLIYNSVNMKDFPVLQACFLFIGICVVVFSIIADILNLLIDPRIKKGGEDYA